MEQSSGWISAVFFFLFFFGNFMLIFQSAARQIIMHKPRFVHPYISCSTGEGEIGGYFNYFVAKKHEI